MKIKNQHIDDYLMCSCNKNRQYKEDIMNGKEYVVTFTCNRMVRNYYTDSRKDAEEKYNLCKDGWRVEILFGTPGYYETVKKNY